LWLLSSPPFGDLNRVLPRPIASFQPGGLAHASEFAVQLLYGSYDERTQPIPNADAIRNAFSAEEGRVAGEGGGLLRAGGGVDLRSIETGLTTLAPLRKIIDDT
jgi:hypothetical protein